VPLDQSFSKLALEQFGLAVTWWAEKQRQPNASAFAIERSPEWYFDAFVRPDAERGALISVNDGCGLALFDATMSLAADPDFIPGRMVDVALVRLGAELRWSRFFDYTWAQEYAQHPRTIGLGFFPLRMTQQPDRLAIADHCFELAVELLFNHEKAHVVLGHVHSRRAPEIAEIRYLETTRDAGVTTLRQYRKEELAADRGALYWVCKHGRDTEYRKTAHLTGLDTVLDWDVYVLLAAGIIFSVVETCERQCKIDPLRRKHPSAAARMLHLLLAYTSMILTDELSHDGLDLGQFFERFWWDYLSGLACIAKIIGVAPMTLRDLQGSILVGTTLGPSDVAAELQPLVNWTSRDSDSQPLPIRVPETFAFLNDHPPDVDARFRIAQPPVL
jgi:hypothetical protein